MKTLTVCTLDCPDACSLVVETDNTGVKRISGNPHHPITAGFSCAKMKRFGNRLRSPNRITKPLLKKNGQWKEIGWEEALDICAEKIQRYRSDPASILHILGGADKGILRMLTDLFFARLGASRVAGCLCDDAGIAACIADFGSLDHSDIRDLIHAHWIVNWGRDPSRSSIHVAALMLKDIDISLDVFIASPLGRLKVKLKTLSGLHPEAVLYRRDDWLKFGRGINQLIEADLTDMGNCAPFYQQYVRLEN